MTREYFLATSLDLVDEIAEVLHKDLSVRDEDLHVLSLDRQGLQDHHLRAARLYQHRDVVRGMELGLIAGVAVGLSMFCCATYALIFSDVSPVLQQQIVYCALGLPLLLGIVLGAVYGYGHENYKIARFHQDLQAGMHVLMVDFQTNRLEQILRKLADYPVTDAGRDSPMIYPFADSQPAGLPS